LIPAAISVWNADGSLATGVIPALFDSQGKEVPLGYFGGEESEFFVTPGHYIVLVEHTGLPDVVQTIEIRPTGKDQNNPINTLLR